MDPLLSPSLETNQAPGRTYVPSATYRLQFHRAFTFQDATSLVAYLDRLGVGACYASPIFQARPGSTHGYDVCNFNRFNPEIGTAQQFDAWVAQLKGHGLGLVLDMVPNHMGIGDPCNEWWWDVLEYGPHSPYASFFDIDWHSAHPGLANKVLLPVLGDHYGRVLERGELKLDLEDGSLVLRYCDNLFPLSPETHVRILQSLRDDPGSESKTITAIADLLPHLERSWRPEKLREISREFKHQLQKAFLKDDRLRQAVAAWLDRLSGPDAPARRQLDELITLQHYRLAFWQVGSFELNYRRFFDVTSLAGLRMEREEVFGAVHQLLLRLLGEGKVQGIRIDHPDGLLDPGQYFTRLQAAVPGSGSPDKGASVIQKRSAGDLSASQVAPEGQRLRHLFSRPVYLVVEKILAEDESLPDGWPVHGTTGYDFMNIVNRLYVDGSKEAEFTAIYETFISRKERYPAIVRQSKRAVLRDLLITEMANLVSRWKQIASRSLTVRDFLYSQWEEGVAAVIAALSVYRTYISAEHPEPSPEDRARLEQAFEMARQDFPQIDPDLFGFLLEVLTLRDWHSHSEQERQARFELVLKFQQLTGPTMAKGAEDTAFYIYNRLLSLNEVGGNPDRFGVRVEEFHRTNQIRQKVCPHSMVATATHDTKRGEDFRARLNVLSEIPTEWAGALQKWSVQAKSRSSGKAVQRNTEYFVYQTLLGAWPPQLTPENDLSNFRARVVAAMIKSVREAKTDSSWLSPNAEYEKAVTVFVESLLSPQENPALVRDLYAFQSRLAFFGYWNSLSQLLLKIASPGMPDFYQGTELWDFNLVDPDNRRPVDYPAREAILRDLDGPTTPQLLSSLVASPEDGRIKLFATAQLLRFRRAHPDLFAQGEYLPLAVKGEKAEHVIAFIRQIGRETVLAAVPRLVVGLTGGREIPPLGAEVWKETCVVLPPGDIGGRFANILTGEEVSIRQADGDSAINMADLCNKFPIAALRRLV